MSSTRLFVRSLPFKLSQEGFQKFFQSFGPIADAHIATDRLTGMSRGFGFITFENPTDAQTVVKKSSLEIEGREVFVDFARESSPRPAGRFMDEVTPNGSGTMRRKFPRRDDDREEQSTDNYGRQGGRSNNYGKRGGNEDFDF